MNRPPCPVKSGEVWQRPWRNRCRTVEITNVYWRSSPPDWMLRCRTVGKKYVESYAVDIFVERFKRKADSVTQSKVIEVFARYRDEVLKRFPDAKAERMDITEKDFWSPQNEMVWNHLFYVCVTGMEYAAHSRMEKAFRWLGFIQGVFFTWGVHSIEELGQHNMPSLTDIAEGR